MTNREFSKEDAGGVLAGSFASPLYSVGAEEVGHYLALKMLGEDPEFGMELNGGISEMSFYVTSSGKSLTEIGEGIVAAAGPFSVLALSGMTAYYSQKTDNEKTKRFLEGISITSALSSAIYAIGDYMNFTQGDFEILSDSLPYEASIPLVLGGTMAVVGYTKGESLKEHFSELFQYASKIFKEYEEIADEYDTYSGVSEEHNPIEMEEMDDEDYEDMIGVIEDIKVADPGTDEWQESLDKLESNYDINPYFIEDAARVYREGIDREKNDFL